jgi:hypothetical protein
MESQSLFARRYRRNSANEIPSRSPSFSNFSLRNATRAAVDMVSFATGVRHSVDGMKKRVFKEGAATS